MNWLWARMQSEPVATQYLVQRFIALLIGFGLPIDKPTMLLTLAFTDALVAWLTRSRVTPNVLLKPPS